VAGAADKDEDRGRVAFWRGVGEFAVLCGAYAGLGAFALAAYVMTLA
jgi:hypothetical protein